MLLASLVLTFSSLLFSVLAAPLVPTQDPFYTQPANISSYAPGAIVRSRDISPGLSGFLVGNTTLKISAAKQYFYRTTDSLGEAVGTVATLLVPNNADPSKLLVYSTAYDSTDPNCVPSYSLRAGGNTTSNADSIFIAASLNRGWYVVTSDYEGPEVQFTAGLQSGHAVLDSVRATLSYAPSNTGLHPNATYALFGYSGGSLASEWAAELAPSYARELNFSGIAIGGLPTNVSSVITRVNNGTNAQLAFSGLRGQANAFANLSAYIDEHLIPAKAAAFRQLAFTCMSRGTTAGENQDLFSYFDTGTGVLTDPVPRSVLDNSGVMGLHGTPAIPMFVYKAVGDEVAPINDTDKLVAEYCQRGVTLQYQVDLVGGHASEAITGSADAFAWLTDRLEGRPLPIAQGSCNTTYVVLSNLSPGSVLALGEVFVAALQSLLLGGPLGPPFPGK